MPLPGSDVPFRHAVDVTRYCYVPMRDGVRLAVDIHRPVSPGRQPVLLVQTPYNKNRFDAAGAARYVAAGYAVAVADVRGTGGSEGELAYYNIPEPRPDGHPEPQEFAGPHDGADLVEWLARREWSTGKVGTFGGSALGIAQLLTARGGPKHLAAMSVEVAPVNYYLDRWFPGGILNMSMVVRWQDGMTENLSPDRAVEDVSGLPGSLDAGAQAVREKVRLDRFRLRAERSRGGRWTAMLERFHELRGLREFGGLWRGYYHAPFLRGCRVPCHYTGVWFDHFVRGSCEAFRAHKGPKRLTVQPGQQGTHGAHADIDMTAEHLLWFDKWLKGEGSGGMDEPPVRLFVMGAEEWRGFSDWPPPEARTRRLALSAGGRLSAAGAARPFRSVLRHDPADPVPWCWIEDLRPLEKRSAVWTTAPLERALAVIGEPRLRLRVRSSSTDGHLHVRIADVAPAFRGREVPPGGRGPPEARPPGGARPRRADARGRGGPCRD